MDKVYNHKNTEEKIYSMWEEEGYFKPEINPAGDPFTIILPPPNANGDLHFGHAMFTVEDILIRYHRMKGDQALWLPGTDHAGTETQYVFEKKLQKEGKSRFDFNREELYKMIWDYVQENRGGIEKQLKRLGFSLDWSRSKFTLDPEIVKIVNKTFRKMYDDKLIYRDYRLVNYCTKDGTSFSDLEVKHVEQKDPLYYIKYGPFVLATVRPETKFGDTAVAVNPSDSRYQEWIGKEIEVEGLLGKFKLKVIGDELIDPNFGTGVAKVTPSIDFKDFEMGKRHNLEMKLIVGFDGRLTEIAGPYAGMKVKQAREKVAQDLQEKGLIEKIDEDYLHTISVCYKCGTTLEPLPLEQWYIKVKELSEMSLKAIDSRYVKVFPKNFEASLRFWYENLRDWNISRQNVWGIQIPVSYEVSDDVEFTVSFISSQKEHKQGKLTELQKEGYSFDEIMQGLQKVIAGINAKVVFEDEKDPQKRYLPETDTFDTWFSSSQWPYVTLKTSNSGDFEKFYPTSVMETGRDILFFWVSRMIMMGLYLERGLGYKEKDETLLKNKVPFRDIVLHGMVLDPYGKKMSKSKGNVVSPIEVADQYGADAVRFALIYGTALGNDQALSYPKLEASRRFTNKLWNMGRFLDMQFTSEAFQGKEIAFYDEKMVVTHEEDKKVLEELKKTIEGVTKAIDSYRLHDGAELLYEFTWHYVADKYIEEVKERLRNGDETALSVLRHVWIMSLKLLHPYMPFVTEELWTKFPRKTDKPLIISPWPKV